MRSIVGAPLITSADICTALATRAGISEKLPRAVDEDVTDPEQPELMNIPFVFLCAQASPCQLASHTCGRVPLGELDLTCNNFTV